jgi:omega-amidase
MKLSLAQINISSGNPKHNLLKMKEWIIKASDENADIVVFPEMCDTGYDMPTILDVAATWKNGPVKYLCRYAEDSNINIIAGLSEREDSSVFNTIVVIDKNGRIVGKYRKTHLITASPIHEEKYLGFGQELVICKLEGMKVGLMTCYEIRFPEIARKLASSGADVIVIPAAFPLVRLSHWQTLTRSRAIENQIFVAATSRIGRDFEYSLQFCGTSTIYDPYGVAIASSSQIHESLVSAEINLNNIKEVRNQIKVYQDIRSDLYQKKVTEYS